MRRPISVDEWFGDELDVELALKTLERSCNPRPAVSFLDTIAAVGVAESDRVLDIGGRDGANALLIAEYLGCRVVSVDPSRSSLASGRELVANHHHGDLVDLRLGSMDAIPCADGYFRLIFARDMIQYVKDLSASFGECGRVLTSDGFIVVYAIFATSELGAEEIRRLCVDGAMVPERLSVADFESSVVAGGFEVHGLEVLGSEFEESAQERGVAPNYLLQMARLRRARASFVAEMGEVVYRAVRANVLWSIYRLMGKLESRIYVLRPAARPLSPRHEVNPEPRARAYPRIP